MWYYTSGFGIRKGLIKSGAALCRPLISNPVPSKSKGKASEVRCKIVVSDVATPEYENLFLVPNSGLKSKNLFHLFYTSNHDFFVSCPRSFDEPLFLKWSFCGMEGNVVSDLLFSLPFTLIFVYLLIRKVVIHLNNQRLELTNERE
jgi:hypothetical protein